MQDIVLFVDQQVYPLRFLESIFNRPVLVSHSAFDALLHLHTHSRNTQWVVINAFFSDVEDFILLIRLLFPYLKVLLILHEGMDSGLEDSVEATLKAPYDLHDIVAICR